MQPLPPDVTHFDRFGLSADVDPHPADLERRWHDLSRKLHPDRFATADAHERRLAAEWSAALNEAWRILKDPTARVGYLLQLQGIGPRDLPKMPREFLEQVMALRELFAVAKRAKDHAAIRRLASTAGERAGQAKQAIDEALAAWRASRSRADLDGLAHAFAAHKYWDRVLLEAAEFEREAAS